MDMCSHHIFSLCSQCGGFLHGSDFETKKNIAIHAATIGSKPNEYQGLMTQWARAAHLVDFRQKHPVSRAIMFVFYDLYLHIAALLFGILLILILYRFVGNLIFS